MKVTGGWFTRQIMGRVHTENNCLIIIEGETGSGKSCLGLSLCQHFDPYFGAKRIAYSGREFLELLPQVPNKGWLLWDEPGVYLSHRRWQSEINIQIMQVIQSFRYKLINVIFCLPTASYMDKVVREMCHYVLRMKRRGQASVYRIVKSPFEGWTFTPYLGTIHSEMPTQMLYREFRNMHTEHQEALYERSRKQMEASEKKKAEKLEQSLKPKRTFEELREKAMLILPRIVDPNKDSDQGLIDMSEMRRILKIPHNKAYNLRKILLKQLHAKDDRILRKIRQERL